MSTPAPGPARPMEDAPQEPFAKGPAVRTSKNRPNVLTVEESARLAEEASQIDLFLTGQLVETWDRSVRSHKLYHQYKRDRRGPDEQWRSLIRLPLPFEAIRAKVAQEREIMTSSDPMIQAAAVGEEDVENARQVEALLEYTLYGNKINRLLINLGTSKALDGTVWVTPHWGRDSFTMNAFPTEGEKKAFAEGLQRATAAGVPPGPDWQAYPSEFEQWRTDVNRAYPNLKIPAPPTGGPREVVRYQGPRLTQVPFFEMRADPRVPEMGDQHAVIRRTVKDREWLDAQLEAGAVDETRVALALEGWNGKMLETEEQRIADLLGYTIDENSPAFKKQSVEIMEVWRVKSPYPYQIILNRKQVINLKPNEFPYRHGQCSLIPVRNILVPGYLYGLGDLLQPEHLFHEANKLRELRLDSVTLATMGVFEKLMSVGIASGQNRIKPGGFVEVSKQGSIRKILGDVDLSAAFKEMGEIKAEIESSMGVGANVKGATATIGRIPAATDQSRLTQALLRFKEGVVTMEDDLQPAVTQILALWYQFSEPDQRVKVHGGGADGYLTVSKDKLLDAFGYDLRFNGATRVLDNAVLVQQLSQFLKDNAALLAPVESRKLIEKIAEALRLKGVSEIVTAEVTTLMQDSWKAQQVQAQKQQTAQGQMDQAAAQGAPASIPLEQAQAIQAQQEGGQ